MYMYIHISYLSSTYFYKFFLLLFAFVFGFLVGMGESGSGFFEFFKQDLNIFIDILASFS